MATRALGGAAGAGPDLTAGRGSGRHADARAARRGRAAVDAPQLPEDGRARHGRGLGRSTRASIRRTASTGAPSGNCSAGADVVVTGYRPGALDRYPLGPAPRALVGAASRVVVAQWSAWGAYGRAGSGAASTVRCRWRRASPRSRGRRPRRARCPRRPSTTARWYLIAAAVLRSLTEQATRGGSRAAVRAGADGRVADGRVSERRPRGGRAL